MRVTHEPPMRLQMRLYTVEAHGEVADLREASHADPRIVDPDDYAYAQGIGRKLRAEGAQGILYPLVRHPAGECLAAFRTGLLRSCLHAAYLEYNWSAAGPSMPCSRSLSCHEVRQDRREAGVSAQAGRGRGVGLEPTGCMNLHYSKNALPNWPMFRHDASDASSPLTYPRRVRTSARCR